MIASVGDPDTILRVDDEVLGSTKLAWLGTMRTPLENKIPFGRKLLYPVEIAVFCNVDIAVGVFDRVGHKTKLARAMPKGAPNGGGFERLSLGRINQHSIIVRVRDKQSSRSVDRQPRGPPILADRRLPASQVVSVCVENLNAGGHVD